MTKPNVSLMLDLETLGTSPDAFVVQISCIAFDDDFNIVSVFNEYIDVWQEQKGSIIDNATVQFWQKQPELVKDIVLGGKTNPITALENFVEWLRAYDVKDVWANSPSFDCVILTRMADRLGVDFRLFPRFWDWRDVRTVKALGKKHDLHFDLSPTHNAMDDCKNQIEILKLVFNHYGI